ncbi:hypothetical protein N8I74_15120 [Chitiniphilus purpureus]|uniref:Serine kinase/phosphatase n=1 Tax=Chitiniphilus purpureus TaxID=2981137 RepID=A0ABY6DJV9_9NEIS|nr:hypothetical protein [Chitiniphilus sp. CD1]UXY14641.1 hypothetical protein N8I74_15120 [Chitiniphilus sp. CD1]
MSTSKHYPEEDERIVSPEDPQFDPAVREAEAPLDQQIEREDVRDVHTEALLRNAPLAEGDGRESLRREGVALEEDEEGSPTIGIDPSLPPLPDVPDEEDPDAVV